MRSGGWVCKPLGTGVEWECLVSISAGYIGSSNMTNVFASDVFKIASTRPCTASRLAITARASAFLSIRHYAGEGSTSKLQAL